MDFDGALAYMQGRLRLGEKYGNDRFLALLQRLGDPQEKLRVIHVAGTKGKGSTTTMAASILQAAGCKVGLYLSPYVYDIRERVQVNGELIPEEDFARLVTLIRPHIEALEQTDFGPVTEFELKTAVGFCFFAEQQVDYTVLEVGLGGRLDATNVVRQPLVTAITNIGFDHMELLGHTLGAIAREKAGIVKPGIPCITGVPFGSEAYESIAEICAAQGAPLLRVSPDGRMTPDDTTYRTAPDDTLMLATPRRAMAGISLRLRGAFQHANAAVAVAALDAIAPEQLPPISDDAVRLGLLTAFVPGRLERVADRPTVVLDGAHNELAAEVLADALREEYRAEKRRVLFVVGLKRNHDPETFLGPLAALRPDVLIATEPSFRPREASEIAVAAKKYDIPHVQVVAESVPAAVRAALAQAGPDDLICITGSFYTVGDVPPAFWTDRIPERNIYT